MSMSNPTSKHWLRIVVMCFGFFGIQHGFSAQFGLMSGVYQKLGVPAAIMSLLWLPAPLTGIVVAPLIGTASDKTWLGWLGRRRPYFLGGAFAACFALWLIPNTLGIPGGWHVGKEIWGYGAMAAVFGLLVLDSALNICMSPARAFLSEQLPEKQIPLGFALQSFMIGIGGGFGSLIVGTDIAKQTPWVYNLLGGFHYLFNGLMKTPFTNIHAQFYACAFVFMLAICITVFSCKEVPPTHNALAEQDQVTPVKGGVTGWFKNFGDVFMNMPMPMMKLCAAQTLTWIGLFCFFLYYSPAVANVVFGAHGNAHSAIYDVGTKAAGLSQAYYQWVATGFALLIPLLVKFVGKTWLHAFGLLCGAIGLFWVGFAPVKESLIPAMVFVGIAWSCILALPFAMLSPFIPEGKQGIYMGVFNMFIALPEVLASLFLGSILTKWCGGDEMAIIRIGGGCMLVACFITLTLLTDRKPASINTGGTRGPAVLA
jgi:maltose/moltooligosaccharide transporter